MIISVEELQTLPEFQDQDTDVLKDMLDGVETLVRKYTNNNFQNRAVRFTAPSQGAVLMGTSPYLKLGDTVQVSQSEVNDGLYLVTGLTDGKTTVDNTLFDVESNLVTKVEYPSGVKMGVINLLKWEIANRGKVGVKSETISRHSVTYFDLDANNQVMGFPVSLLGFLELYKKARF